MRKKEILNLIEHNQIIKRHNNLLSIIKDEYYKNRFLDKKYWFPDIEQLKEEFSILGKEISQSLEETIVSKKYIQSNCCHHEVRLEHYGLFCSNYECVFCGKNIVGDNCINWEYSTNRNKHCVSLVAKYQNDDDYGYISKGYTNEDIYEIIINILKDKEIEEEVDLIQEFKKLNLLNCTINEDKKVEENYILIISGSNQQYIDKESYIYKKGLNIGVDFLKYFIGLLNTKVELIDNNVLKELEEQNKYIKCTKYETLEELEKIIINQKEIPFKIIIDISELFEYKINDNEILKLPYNLNLHEYFPNTHIIRITNLSTKTLGELSSFLQDKENTYAYNQNQYYHFDNETLIENNLENTCLKIKKLLKRNNN